MSRPPKENAAIAVINAEIEIAEKDLAEAQGRVGEVTRMLRALHAIRDRIGTPPAPGNDPKPPRAARNSIPADILSAIDKHAINHGGQSMTLAKIETATGKDRSSIRKALASLLKAGKVSENALGEWGLRAADTAKAAE